jgi:phytoene dehydrogenase-like protein
VLPDLAGAYFSQRATLGGSRPMEGKYDGVVIGAGPNGLAAAITCARAGLAVLLIEGAPTVGGGARSAELTLPGFVHDVCSAVHPLAVISPFFRGVPLADYGLTWAYPEVPLAHPLEGGRAAVLERSFGDTARTLETDGPAYERVYGPFVREAAALYADALARRWVRPSAPRSDIRGSRHDASGRAHPPPLSSP